MSRVDNPQAFPMPASEHSQGGHFEQNGMSLRDWFAGMALQGILACPDTNGSIEEITRYSYLYADAMLAERAKGEPI